MRIALVGARVGYINRGFESFTRDLFDVIRDDTDVVLFKGAGTAGPQEVVIPSLWLQGGLLSRLPLSPEQRMRWNERSYAAGMVPHLLRGRFDVIHFSEYEIGRVLLRLRRACGLKYRLLFSNGAPAPPQLYRCFDFVQEVSAVRLDEARACGLSQERLRLVPYGIDCGRFAPPSAAERARLRALHGVPADRFTVVCAAAIKKQHKRIDHLIREVARLDRSRFFLVVAGQPTEETAALRRMADELLGDAYRFLTLPHADMHHVYQLGDLFVLPSLTEGLGIVILEAMATGLPVLVHDDPLFRWVVDLPPCTIDMSAPETLAANVTRFADDPDLCRSVGTHARDNTICRFDWQRLKPEYLAMYADAAKVNLVGSARGIPPKAKNDVRPGGQFP